MRPLPSRRQRRGAQYRHPQLIPREENRVRIVAFSFGCHVSSLALAGLGDYIRDFLIIGTSALGRTDRPVMDFPKERTGMTEDERNAVHRGVLEMLMFPDPEHIDDLAIALTSRKCLQGPLSLAHPFPHR